MIPVMKTAPISDMKIQQSRVLNQLAEGPILLMQRSTPAAVMVSPQEWNRTAERLQRLEALVEAQRIIAQTPDDGWISSTEMRERMAKHGVVIEYRPNCGD